MTLYGGDVYIEVGMSVSQNRNVFFTKKLEFFFFLVLTLEKTSMFVFKTYFKRCNFLGLLESR